MDLDLLIFGERVCHDDQWDIQRSEISEYAFVAKPLADLAPGAVHPETGLTFREMWQEGKFGGQELWPVDLP